MGRGYISSPPDNNTPPFVLSFGGGAIVPHVSLQLIFWGQGWSAGTITPSADNIAEAVRILLAGPYMSALLQYGVGLGTLRGSAFVGTGPPAPFSMDDVKSLIWDMIDNGVFPEPDDPGGRNLYMVITPPGAAHSDTPGKHGHDWDFDFPADYDIDWVGYATFSAKAPNVGDINELMPILFHEIVEGCTDPEQDGWRTNLQSDITEIGDMCESRTDQVSGFGVQAYWSNLDNACIIPTAFSVWHFLRFKNIDPALGLSQYLAPNTSMLESMIATP